MIEGGHQQKFRQIYLLSRISTAYSRFISLDRSCHIATALRAHCTEALQPLQAASAQPEAAAAAAVQTCDSSAPTCSFVLLCWQGYAVRLHSWALPPSIVSHCGPGATLWNPCTRNLYPPSGPLPFPSGKSIYPRWELLLEGLPTAFPIWEIWIPRMSPQSAMFQTADNISQWPSTLQLDPKTRWRMKSDQTYRGNHNAILFVTSMQENQRTGASTKSSGKIIHVQPTCQGPQSWSRSNGSWRRRCYVLCCH